MTENHNIPSEMAMSKLTSAQLRLEEAKYLYMQFRTSCGPPTDTYFLMAVYFDSYLFSLISVEDILPAGKDEVRNVPEFAFLKALRNISAHHSVLAVLRV
jgi:hypothetical protein